MALRVSLSISRCSLHDDLLAGADEARDTPPGCRRAPASSCSSVSTPPEKYWLNRHGGTASPSMMRCSSAIAAARRVSQSVGLRAELGDRTGLFQFLSALQRSRGKSRRCCVLVEPLPARRFEQPVERVSCKPQPERPAPRRSGARTRLDGRRVLLDRRQFPEECLACQQVFEQRVPFRADPRSTSGSSPGTATIATACVRALDIVQGAAPSALAQARRRA